jgi:hypothetical protein
MQQINKNNFNKYLSFLYLAQLHCMHLYFTYQQKEMFMQQKIDFIVQQIESKKYNIRGVCRLTGVSNATIYKINQGHGMNVRPYIIDVLYDFFKKTGE